MDEARDRTEDLVVVLDLPAEEFAEWFRAGWTENHGPMSHDLDAYPSGGFDGDVTPWFNLGAPPQLMIRVFDHGVYVAAPEGVRAE